MQYTTVVIRVFFPWLRECLWCNRNAPLTRWFKEDITSRRKVPFHVANADPIGWNVGLEKSFMGSWVKCGWSCGVGRGGGERRTIGKDKSYFTRTIHYKCPNTLDQGLQSYLWTSPLLESVTSSLNVVSEVSLSSKISGDISRHILTVLYNFEKHLLYGWKTYF